MLFLLLVLALIASFYWLKSSLDEGISRIEARLEAIEDKLRNIKQQPDQPENRS